MSSPTRPKRPQLIVTNSRDARVPEAGLTRAKDAGYGWPVDGSRAFARRKEDRMAPRTVALITASALVLLLPASASATHVRPAGATPKYDPLVITYENCTSPGGAVHTPTSTQGQRFACTPPIPSSPYLTAGTPDSNGVPSDFVGSVRLEVCPAAVCGNADVFVTV